MSEDDEWKQRAACLGMDLDFLDYKVLGYSDRNKLKEKEIKDVCASCSVDRECLEYAISTKQTLGVWGGKTPTQRKKLQLSRKRDTVRG